MRISIKARQVIAVTIIVAVVVVILGGLYASAVVRVQLDASQAAGELLANAIYHRAREAVASGGDPYAALADDAGLRSILESSAYSPNVTYAAITAPSNAAIAHGDAQQVGATIPERQNLETLLAADWWTQLTTIYADGAVTLEITRPLLMGERRFGTIRIGVSMLLTRADLDRAVRPAAITAVVAVVTASLVAMLLAQSLLRPIHLIRAGLSRRSRSTGAEEPGVQGLDEHERPGGVSGAVEFDTSAGRAAADAALRRARIAGALGRVTAGVAHELKNPLNAMAIHLELLRQSMDLPAASSTGEAERPSLDRASAQEHLTVIDNALRRLDDVLQGYLKFIRPEDVEREPLSLDSLFGDVLPIVRAEARRSGIEVHVDCAPDLPPVLGDAGLLHQALLNLALNACQAMPGGGRLRLSGRAVKGGRIEMTVEDTGPGIPPEHLDKVFDLYFTTRPGGSGMGLSLVYRTVQLHDGEIEVDSAPGTGTVFRVLLPAAGSDGAEAGSGS